MFDWGTFFIIFTLAFISSWGGFYIAQKKSGVLEKWQWRLTSFGMGILLGVSFLEFLPHTMEHHPQLSPLLMVAGIVFIIFVEVFIAPKLDWLEGKSCAHDHAKDHDRKSHIHLEHQHHLISHQAACSAVGCLIVCAFFDGLEMAAAFYLGEKTGILTSIGLVFHILPDGILAANIALAGGMSTGKAKFISLVTGFSLITGAVFSLLLGRLLPSFHYVLPLAAGILIYVSLVHLLPVAMKTNKGAWALGGLMFFLLLKYL
ncbi:MAG: ZIP family metal transporter [Halobacteriovoraceae bacterium]|nr:ZIP family metal transporter [Halobacteriovoraceae bacterium]